MIVVPTVGTGRLSPKGGLRREKSNVRRLAFQRPPIVMGGYFDAAFDSTGIWTSKNCFFAGMKGLL